MKRQYVVRWDLVELYPSGTERVVAREESVEMSVKTACNMFEDFNAVADED